MTRTHRVAFALSVAAVVVIMILMLVSPAHGTPAFVLEPGIGGMDRVKEIRVVQGAPPWVDGAVDVAVAQIDSATGAGWWHGPDVPYDGTVGVAQLQLPEPSGQAWIFADDQPGARTDDPGWPAGDWTTWQVFDGTHLTNGVTTVDRSLTEVIGSQPNGWVLLHELGHVAGLDDDPGSGGVMSDTQATAYSPGDLAGLDQLAQAGFGGGRGVPVPSVTVQLIPPVTLIRPATPAVRPPERPRAAPTTTTTPTVPDAPEATGRPVPVYAALRYLNLEEGLDG